MAVGVLAGNRAEKDFARLVHVARPQSDSPSAIRNSCQREHASREKPALDNIQCPCHLVAASSMSGICSERSKTAVVSAVVFVLFDAFIPLLFVIPAFWARCREQYKLFELL
jgi:hypothetical protein